MKLLYCPVCADVVRLIVTRWRMCECKLSGGQYNQDGMTATLGGYARVFGVANPFFNELWNDLDEMQRMNVRKRNNYGPGDCWWGEFAGDVQIIRVTEASGPRIKMRIHSQGNSNRIVILDKRSYSIDKKERLAEIVVPANPSPSFKGKKR